MTSSIAMRLNLVKRWLPPLNHDDLISWYHVSTTTKLGGSKLRVVFYYYLGIFWRHYFFHFDFLLWYKLFIILQDISEASQCSHIASSFETLALNFVYDFTGCIQLRFYLKIDWFGIRNSWLHLIFKTLGYSKSSVVFKENIYVYLHINILYNSHYL